jgi:hypothetical protein
MSLSIARLLRSTISHPASLRSILVLPSSYLRLVFQAIILLQVFPAKPRNYSSFPCVPHSPILCYRTISYTIEYCRCTLCKYSPTLVTSSLLLHPNIPFSILNLNIHLIHRNKQITKGCILTVTSEPLHKFASNMEKRVATALLGAVEIHSAYCRIVRVTPSRTIFNALRYFSL